MLNSYNLLARLSCHNENQSHDRRDDRWIFGVEHGCQRTQKSPTSPFEWPKLSRLDHSESAHSNSQSVSELEFWSAGRLAVFQVSQHFPNFGATVFIYMYSPRMENKWQVTLMESGETTPENDDVDFKLHIGRTEYTSTVFTKSGADALHPTNQWNFFFFARNQ